jgi:hypothetical protein
MHRFAVAMLGCNQELATPDIIEPVSALAGQSSPLTRPQGRVYDERRPVRTSSE